MPITTTLAVVALVGAVLLVLQPEQRAMAVLAVVAAGFEVAMAFGWVRLSVQGIPLMLVLGAVLAVAGGLLYARMQAKSQVAAATIVTFVGVLQVLTSLGVL